MTTTQNTRMSAMADIKPEHLGWIRELEVRVANPALFAAADDLAEAELALRAAVASGAAVWLSPREAAARIPNMTVQRLTALRKRQQGPRFWMPNFGTFMYLEADVEAYCVRLQEAA